MRRWICVPMITLCLLLSGCTTAKEETETLRERYQTMSGCDMEAEIICRQNDREWTAILRCAYVPEGECRVEVLEPETISGICAVISDGDWRLEYEDVCLDIGALGSEDIHPATALPRLMDALRGGWLLEENEETWKDTPCMRLTVDQTGENGGKILSTLWLRQEDGTPLRGEISTDGEVILTAEFTKFTFYDTISQ